MTTFALIAVSVLVVTGFVALFLWSRRVERDEIDWEAPHREGNDRQTNQLGIALNVNGTFSR